MKHQHTVSKAAHVSIDRQLGVTFKGERTESQHFPNALSLDSDRIARFCVADASRISQDLVTLCGAIWWADRKITRNRATAWGRQISIEVAVFEKDQLASHAAALEDVLQFLTGDDWRIEFVARTDAPMRIAALDLEAVTYDAVMPYSDGLDSFAQYRLLAAKGSVLRVRTSTRNKKRLTAGSKILGVPLTISHAKREASFRTRAFVFFIFAALAASASGTAKVVIAENGQGSLAPALIPFANEWPFRSTHPGFIRRLQNFLNAVLPKPLEFVQPQLWRTKGEVLELLRQADVQDGWFESDSCSNNHRYQYGNGQGCGFCGGCILRRVSVAHARLPAEQDLYAFGNPASSTLAVTEVERDRPFDLNETDIVRHAVKSMNDFPIAVADEMNQARLRGECLEIAPSSPADALVSLKRLARQHELEWKNYIGKLPGNAAFRALAEA